MRGDWELIDLDNIYQFVFAPLPDIVQKLAQKVPPLKDALEDLGVNRLTALWKAKDLDVPIPPFSQEILTDLIYAQDIQTGLDLPSSINFDDQQFLSPQFQTLSNRYTRVLIKPSLPVDTLTALLTLKPKSPTADLEPTTSPEKMILAELTFQDPDQDGIYTAEFPTPYVSGGYDLLAYYNTESPAETSPHTKISLLIDPEGYVYEEKEHKELLLPNVQVSLFQINPENQQESLWDASPYNQTNPQITNETGRYSFFVPQGQYLLRTQAEDYHPYQSETLEVQANEGVHEKIRLTRKFSWRILLEWPFWLVWVILFLFIFIFILIFWRRRKDEEEGQNQTPRPPNSPFNPPSGPQI